MGTISVTSKVSISKILSALAAVAIFLSVLQPAETAVAQDASTCSYSFSTSTPTVGSTVSVNYVCPFSQTLDIQWIISGDWYYTDHYSVGGGTTSDPLPSTGTCGFNRSGYARDCNPVGLGLWMRASKNATYLREIALIRVGTVSLPQNFKTTPQPTITGLSMVGSLLNASPGNWDFSDVHFTYQWLRDGNSIEGATDSTYLLGSNDLSHQVSVSVTASYAGYSTTTRTSNSRAISASFTDRTTSTITYTFDTCGQISGRTGPTQQQCANTNANFSELFSTGYEVQDGLQKWIAPVSATYNFEASGAIGGGQSNDGRSAVINFNMFVRKGQILKMLVGQEGLTLSSDTTNPEVQRGGSGGGATFITLDGDPVVVAAGSGGGGSNPYGFVDTSATRYTSDSSSPAIAWADRNQWYGGTGAGYYAPGQSYNLCTFNRASALINGGQGGLGSSRNGLDGGFGGGGEVCMGTASASGGGWGAGYVPDMPYYISSRNGKTYIDIQRGGAGLSYVNKAAAAVSFNSVGQGTGYVKISFQAQKISQPSDLTVLGRSSVGALLTADSGIWKSNVSLSYQWLRNNLPIYGETSTNYLVTSADVASQISVTVTASEPGYESTTFASQPVTIATPVSEMGSKNWPRVASNSDGTKLAAIAGDNTIWTSSDSGANWIQRTGAGITSTGEVLPNGTRSWQRVSSSSDGTKLAAVVYDGSVWTSSDSGETWIERPASGVRFWSDIASSADGTKLVALAYPGGVWTSTDSGSTWTERTNAGYRNWGAVASNADGTVIVASWNDGSISVSHDSGLNWTVSSIPSNFGWWRALASNADGSRLYGVEWCGGVWESKDSGSTWARNESFPTKTWYSIAVNADGSKIIAGSWAAECWGTPTDGKISLAISLNKFTPTELATVQGGDFVGSNLQAQVGDYPTGTSLSYQWLRDGVAIDGATEPQFLVRRQDLNHKISYQLVATKSGYESLVLTSSELEITKRGFSKFVAPVVKGKSKVGSVLSASVTSMGSRVSYSYQWLRDGVAIEGATERKYVLGPEDANATITFEVCGSKPSYETACLGSNSSVVGLGELRRQPKVGLKWTSLKTGAVIQSRSGAWDAGVTLSYSWLRDGVEIANETEATYQLTDADRGHTIAFKVVAEKPGYNTATRSSVAKLIP